MPLTFPTIKCPGRRSYTPGSFPVRDFVAQSGATTKVIRGDRMTDATFGIEYPYIPDTEVALVLAFWETTLGGFRDVTLPIEQLDGMDEDIINTIPTYLAWYMTKPEVRSLQPGLSSLSIGFKGQLPAR